MNIIKVKAMSNGEVKGRAYTYKSDIDVAVGDVVMAEFGNSEQRLQVVETGLSEGEIEGLDFEIKTIIGLASEEEMQSEESINLEVTEEQLPVITINYEQVKAALTSTLTKYENLIVTAETLSGCKTTQKELAGLRSKVDTYRKDKKKVFSEPITAFENQCKELIALIEKAEQPIKEGIKVFDDKKRDTKRAEAEQIIKEIIEAEGLNEKYGARLDVLEKYCNLIAKKSDVKTDIEQRAFGLKVEQDREQELLDIIEASIETENQRINKKLTLADFDRLIKAGASTKDILADIKVRANSIYEAENPAPKEEPVHEPAPIEAPVLQAVTQPQEAPKVEKEPKLCFMEISCIGSLERLKQALETLREAGLVVEVLNRGEI